MPELPHPSWFFAPLSGGEESGLNESGIEAFKRAESLGRETCQNILDHSDGSGRPCIAVFEYLDLPRADFPGGDQFVEIFTACRDHVLRMLPDGAGNERRFFQKGLQLLHAETIPTLRIGDENTTGLEGSDDDRSSPFWRLLKGQGFSSLQGVGGGTYGIGQRAPFARSALRTVLYSTRLASSEEAFIAKSILASHPSSIDPRRAMTQSKGWYCHAPANGQQQWRAIRDSAVIRERYRRSLVGTDLYVTGYLEQDWEQQVRHSVLQSFVSAIDRGLLEVRLKRNGTLLGELTRTNLEGKLIEAADEARRSQSKAEYRQGLGATLYYLKALREPFNAAPFTRHIDNLGTARLYIHRDIKDSEVPERWACMRRPMMVVEDHGSGLLSRFAGVLVCDDDTGNQLLAQMEDPRHSRWHEEEARNWTPPEQKRGREARLAISRFVSDTLKKIRDDSMPLSQDVPFLGRYLPLEAGSDEDSAIGTATEPTGGATVSETGHRTTAPTSNVLTGRARRAQATPIRIQVTAPTGGEQSGEDASGGETLDGSTGGGATDGGDGGGGGGSGGGGSDRTGAGTAGTQSGSGSGQGSAPGTGPSGRLLTAADVRFRSYLDGDHYCVILESKKDVQGEVELRAVGEDSTYPIRLTSARDAASGTELTIRGARVTGLKLAAGQLTRIEVTLDESSGSLCLSLAR